MQFCRSILRELLAERIVMLDGAMGTMIQQLQTGRGRLPGGTFQGLAPGRERQQ